jgi:hypothetical protein
LDKVYPEVRVSIIGLSGIEYGLMIYKEKQVIDHAVPALPAGLHVLKVNTGNKAWTKKIITH